MWWTWVLLAVSLVGNLVSLGVAGGMLPRDKGRREPEPETQPQPICMICRWRGWDTDDEGQWKGQKRRYCEALCGWCSGLNGTTRCRAVYSPRVDPADAEDPRWAEVEREAREKERKA